jgi:ABC-type transport system involved in multi-copper enzyme maturation permease subunit
MAALTIARLTVVEASRRKLLLALGLMTLLVIGLTSWGFSRLPGTSNVTPAQVRLGSAYLTIFVAFMFSGVLALGSTLVASPAIASDIESGIALAILPRPIRRSEVVLGKWLGLTGLVAAYATASGVLELVGIWWATGYLPPDPAGAIAFIAAEGVVLMTLTLLLSTRLAPMTAGIIALVMFFAAWMGGIALAIGEVFRNDTIKTIGNVSRLLIPTDGLWHGAIYELEPDVILNLIRAAGRAAVGNPFQAASPQPVPYLIWVAVWVVGMLALTNWSFGRRDL